MWSDQSELSRPLHVKLRKVGRWRNGPESAWTQRTLQRACERKHQPERETSFSDVRSMPVEFNDIIHFLAWLQEPACEKMSDFSSSMLPFWKGQIGSTRSDCYEWHAASSGSHQEIQEANCSCIRGCNTFILVVDFQQQTRFGWSKSLKRLFWLLLSPTCFTLEQLAHLWLASRSHEVTQVSRRVTVMISSTCYVESPPKSKTVHFNAITWTNPASFIILYLAC